MTQLQARLVRESLRSLQQYLLLPFSLRPLLFGISITLALTLVTELQESSMRFSNFEVAWNAQGWEAITIQSVRPSIELPLKVSNY